jgi:hypothetical protein
MKPVIYALICSGLCILLVFGLVSACRASFFEDDEDDGASDRYRATSAEDGIGYADETAPNNKAASPKPEPTPEEFAAQEAATAAAEKQSAAAAEKARKEREKTIANFPVKLVNLKIMHGSGNDDNTYISLSIKNTGKKTIKNFSFTYIGYDADGEPRAEADDEIFSYTGKIKPGKTLDLIAKGQRWQISDHTSEGWYDDYGERYSDDDDGDYDPDSGNFNDYYGDYGDDYTGSYEAPFQTRTIKGVEVSIYQATTTKGDRYYLGPNERTWSDIVRMK